MRKIVVLLISLMLVLSIVASTSFVTFAYAKKPDDVPPLLEKRVFIHFRKGFGKPDGTPGRGPPPKEEDHSKHYALLGKGVKWKTTAIIYIDPDNPQGLSEDFIINVIKISAEEWDDGAYSGWGGVEMDLFDGYNVIHDATFDTDSPDGRNEILFGDYPQEGVIAVTVVWGYFSGPPKERKIIEFGIMFDTDYIWGDATIDSTVMDLQNIATHEFGHGAGLDDIYNCELETMYGYSYYGETIKRDLYIGDIAGIQELYG